MEDDQPYQAAQESFQIALQPYKLQMIIEDLKKFQQVALSFGDKSQMKSYLNKLKKCIMKDRVQKIDIPIEYKIKNPTKSPFCSITVGYSPQNSIIFRCLDCMEAANTVICKQCFFASDHQGHNYLQIFSGEGCCDCGNEQMLNPKGFCPEHSAKVTQVMIDQQVSTLFLAETSFLFHICLWMELKSKENCLDKEFTLIQIKSLFDKLIELAGLNYDYKLLCFKTMQQICSQLYPNLPALGYNNTIMEIFFRVPARDYLNNFCRFVFQIFPVKELKPIILKQYFKKTRQDIDFDYYNPLKMLGFQFMTCIKTINQMIKQKSLDFFQLPPALNITNPNSVYLKFIEDIHYPITMKGIEQYVKMLFQSSNITKFFFTYRQLPDQRVAKEVFDGFYLKIFSIFIKTVKCNKKILKKIIDDLLEYLIEKKEVCRSLAHERALALTLVAYLDSDILSLANPHKAKQFRKTLGLDQNNIKELLQPIIMRHLQSLLYDLYEKPRTLDPKQIIEYFYQRFPEQQNLLILDCCFQKIFALISYGYVSYSSSILPNIIQRLIPQPDKQFKIYKLLSFLNFAFSIDVDICAAAIFVGLINQHSNLFYNRLISTFNQISSVAVKKLALKVLPSHKLFQQFVKHQCVMQKGILKIKKQFQVLQYLSYSGFLKQFSIEMKNVQKITKKQTFLHEFQSLSIWTNQNVESVINIYLQYVSNESNLAKKNNSSGFSPQSFGIQLAKIFVNSNNENLEAFFIQEIYPLSQRLNWLTLTEILKQILPIKFAPQQAGCQEEMKSAKRNKLLNKKKEQAEKMKKKHHQILKDYQCSNNQASGDACIFCKQNNEQGLQLVSQVKIDDFFSHQVQKEQSFRISFRTCGHKIHSSCFYNQVNLQVPFCFLCKRPTNLLVPDFKKDKLSLQATMSFLNVIYPTLLNHVVQQKISSFFKNQCKQNILRAIINSIIVQILTLSIHEKSFIRHNIKPILQQLFHVIKQLQWEQVRVAFQIDQTHQSGSSLSDYQAIIRNILRDYFKLKQDFHIEVSKQNPTQIQKLTMKILDYLNGDSIQLNDCSPSEIAFANFDEYIFKMPHKLSQLQRFMGRCPLCPQITSNILLCILCGWRGCIKNTSLIIAHFASHKNKTFFVNCHTGESYFHQFINLGKSALYINYLGQPYNKNELYQNTAKHYNLNETKFNNIVKGLIRNEKILAQHNQLY